MLTRFLRLSLFLFGLLLLIPSALTTFNRESIDQAMIVSSNFQDYDQALYLMTDDGIPLKRLTRIPGAEQFIAASNDGEWMIVQSRVNLRYYSVHVVTGHVFPIGDDHHVIVYGWSPNGEWILAQDNDYTPNSSRYTLNRRAPNGEAHPLATSPSFIHSPVWSPDGEWVYFSVDPSPIQNGTRIYRVRGDGGGTQPISGEYELTKPLWWSPDGEWLYFSVNFPHEGTRLGRVRPNGEDEEILPASGEVWVPPNWEDGDTWLYYSARRNEQTEIYRYHTGTGEEQQLTDLDDKDYIIGWSPNGKWLYFRNMHHPSNTMTVYRMTPVGSSQEVIYEQSFLPYIFEYYQGSGDNPVVVFSSSRREHRYTVVMLENADAPHFERFSYHEVIGISPDSQWMMLLENGSAWNAPTTIVRIHAKTGTREVISSDNVRYIFTREIPRTYQVAFSPSDEWIYYETETAAGMMNLSRMRVDGSDRQIVHQSFGNNNLRPQLLTWIDYDVEEASHGWLVIIAGLCLMASVLGKSVLRIFK